MLRRPNTPKAAFGKLTELTGIPWEVWKASGMTKLYLEMHYKPEIQKLKKAKANFNPFTDDPNCKTCGKK